MESGDCVCQSLFVCCVNHLYIYIYIYIYIYKQQQKKDSQISERVWLFEGPDKKDFGDN